MVGVNHAPDFRGGLSASRSRRASGVAYAADAYRRAESSPDCAGEASLWSYLADHTGQLAHPLLIRQQHKVAGRGLKPGPPATGLRLTGVPIL
jgi:hypothetical protein